MSNDLEVKATESLMKFLFCKFVNDFGGRWAKMGKRFRSLSNSEFESVVVKSMTCIFFDQKSIAGIFKSNRV
jgi:hypothetical protein